MAPWPFDAGMIECHGTPLGLVDLHNDCDVQSLHLDMRTKAVTLTFVTHTATTFRIAFDDAEILAVDAHPGEDHDVLHGIDYYPHPGSGRPASDWTSDR
ncbi:hypothetical protein [Actinokineospora fastidiosa]|nr:hypothetical protein [Actinokineospora fastidiosa]